MSIKAAKKILEYWYNIECFTPFDAKNKESKMVINPTDKIPWETTGNERAYNVYLGKIKVHVLLDFLKQALKLSDKDYDIDESVTCVCALKLSSNGAYMEGSFSAAHFSWAVSQVIKSNSLDVDLSDEALSGFNQSIDEKLTGISESLTYEGLNKIYSIVTNELKIKFEDDTLYAVCNPDFGDDSVEEANNETLVENELLKTDNASEMFSSFYKKDLRNILNLIEKDDVILSYILSPLAQRDGRVEIDSDINKMKEWLNPRRYPLGKWPSLFNPSLMQQMAINIAVSGKEHFFSVNGPPGTGKTTLLKEVIASNIVERARLLVQYEKPDEAFEMDRFQNHDDKYSNSFYKFKDSELSSFSIIVASNNNAAVENISRELPIAFDSGKTLTGYFENTEEDIYFTAAAKALNKTKAWGLISARLGKKANIREFLNIVVDDKLVGVKALIPSKKDIDFHRWTEAKKAFENKLGAVLLYREKIIAVAEKKYNYNRNSESGIDMAQRVSRLELEIDCTNTELKNLLEEQKNIQNLTEQSKLELDLKNSQTGLFKKIKNALLGENDELREVKSRLLILFEKERDNCKNVEKLEANKEKLEDEFIKLLALRKEINDFDDEYGKMFGDSYVNDDFFMDISNNRKSQKTCPWVNQEYNKMREELFFLALKVHKEFILASNAVKQNLDRYRKMIDGEYKSKSDKNMAYASLLNTIQLVVPVISTTFASISAFLQYVDKRELGTLIIDEAGQATPLSAVGALWRTKKAIVVGDPLQVTPVVNTPVELVDILARLLSVDEAYCSPHHSVQSFADNINPYGGCRKKGDEPLWIGCPLVVHRRCLSPMFDISNQIAYEGRMFNETRDDSAAVSLSMENSIWLDIKGPEKGMKDHYVAAQGQKAVELFAKAFSRHGTDTSLYVISPFKSVITSFKSALHKHLKNSCQPGKAEQEKLKGYIDKSCGTVHTFQGKEANEVILLLGCDQKSGRGAANWVGSGPNILNVAASRAKYRITIIGDKELWKKVKFFDDAIRLIEK